MKKLYLYETFTSPKDVADYFNVHQDRYLISVTIDSFDRYVAFFYYIEE